MMMFMMAMDDKTEKATPKKKKDSRDKGQVLKSGDVSTAFILIAMFGTLRLFGSYFVEKISIILTYYLTNFDFKREILTTRDISSIFFNISFSIFVAMYPILLSAVISSLLINYLQVGFLLSSKALQPKFERLNPLQGIKKMVSIRALVELAKSIIKSVIIISLVYKEMKKSFADFPSLVNSDINISLKHVIDLTMNISFKIGIALLILAAFDYLYQWWDYQKNLKMSKQEVKDEFKQMEGDPKIKAKIRQKQMQMGMARMMSEVPKAHVVIANPTHFAIALRYDDKEDSAPLVLAKGKDYVALKIKEKAKEHNIEIIENRPLAQALYATAEIGEQIPQEFYVAVAQILAEIYSIKNR